VTRVDVIAEVTLGFEIIIFPKGALSSRTNQTHLQRAAVKVSMKTDYAAARCQVQCQVSLPDCGDGCRQFLGLHRNGKKR
jgi:hypothetical protein